jgi:hypothetical protein
VIGYLENNTTKSCSSNFVSETLYDANGNVLGNETGYLSPVYPPGRWVSSNAFTDVPGTPARAEIKVSGLTWSDNLEDTSPFKTLQDGYYPRRRARRSLTPQFEYEGQTINGLGIRAILFAADGTPVGEAQQLMQNVAPGTTAFELQGYMPKSPVSSVEITYAVQ